MLANGWAQLRHEAPVAPAMVNGMHQGGGAFYPVVRQHSLPQRRDGPAAIIIAQRCLNGTPCNVIA